MENLRERQIVAIKDLRMAYASGKRAPILRAPTGFGKTHTTAEVIRSAASRGKTVWFAAHLDSLWKDTSKRLTASKIAHGYIAAGYPMDLKQKVQVVSIDTLVRRLGKISQRPDLLIIDEAHIGMDRTAKVRDALGNPMMLLLTATPSRLDGRGLGEIADCIVETCGTQELIDEGLLVPIKYYAPSSVDMSGVKSVAGDYRSDQAAAVMDKPSVTGNAVSHYIELGKGRPGLFYCVSIEHAKHTAEEFNSAGLRAVVVSGSSSEKERDDAIRMLSSGEVDIVCNCALWVAGVDCPAISYIGWLRPTQSLTVYLQGCGRGMRTSPGKKNLIISDHANNWETHGSPTDDREWSLDGDAKKKKKKQTDVPIKRCPQCWMVYGASAKTCPNGHAQEVKPRVIEQVDGALQEIDLDAERKAKRIEQGKASTLEDLIAIGKSRNMKNPHGWAKHVLAARQNKHA